MPNDFFGLNHKCTYRFKFCYSHTNLLWRPLASNLLFTVLSCCIIPYCCTFNYHASFSSPDVKVFLMIACLFLIVRVAVMLSTFLSRYSIADTIWELKKSTLNLQEISSVILTCLAQDSTRKHLQAVFFFLKNNGFNQLYNSVWSVVWFNPLFNPAMYRDVKGVDGFNSCLIQGWA